MAYESVSYSTCPFFFFFKKEMENFIQARFENYTLGRASQKALRTVSHFGSQGTVA